MPGPDPRVVLVLEDEAWRVEAMRAALAAREGLQVIDAATCDDFREAFALLSERLALISLDQHLARRSHGSGLDAARWLAGQSPRCPVIVHTSDVAAAAAIVELLRAAGWTAEGFPFGRELWAWAAEQRLPG